MTEVTAKKVILKDKNGQYLIPYTDNNLNNPYTLFDSKYSEAPLYNASWLLSNGTYYSKSVYVTAYEALVVENNTEIDAGTSVQLPSGTTYIKRGLSVKLSTAEDITDYDFVINTTDETFRLPIKTNLASGKTVMGNGIALGYTDGSQYGGFVHDGTNDTRLVTTAYGVAVGATVDYEPFTLDNVAIGLTTDPAKSGLELSYSGLYLYFYVGETVQNANLIDAGRFAEQFSEVNSRPYITETYQNGASGYRVWSDGFCEQWGYCGSNGDYTFLKTFKDTNYTVSACTGNETKNSYAPVWNNKRTDKIYFYRGGSHDFDWQVAGYIA